MISITIMIVKYFRLTQSYINQFAIARATAAVIELRDIILNASKTMPKTPAAIRVEIGASAIKHPDPLQHLYHL